MGQSRAQRVGGAAQAGHGLPVAMGDCGGGDGVLCREDGVAVRHSATWFENWDYIVGGVGVVCVWAGAAVLVLVAALAPFYVAWRLIRRMRRDN